MNIHQIKNTTQRILFSSGKVHKILLGPLKGFRYRVDELSGWSHLLGRWEPEAVKFFVQTIKTGQVVYDLGANTGMFSMLFSRLVGEKGRVFSFEPLRANLERINENLLLNGIKNITVVEKAVSDRGGEGFFNLGKDNFQGALSEKGETNQSMTKVMLTSLDDFIEAGAPGPDVIKMDIEGGEGRALEGFNKNIEKFRPILVIELHSPEQDLIVGQFLQAKHYRVCRLGSKLPLQQIKNLKASWPAPDGIWGTIVAYPSSV